MTPPRHPRKHPPRFGDVADVVLPAAPGNVQEDGKSYLMPPHGRRAARWCLVHHIPGRTPVTLATCGLAGRAGLERTAAMLRIGAPAGVTYEVRPIPLQKPKT